MAEEKITQEVISDEKFNEFIVGLCAEEWEHDQSVLLLSISFVEFLCGETHCAIFCEASKLFWVMKNGRREQIGHWYPGKPGSEEEN